MEMEGGGDAPPEVQDENAGTKDLLDNILATPLIGEKIVSYLSFGDMKMVSETSKAFKEMIRETRAFGDKAVLLICKDTVNIPKFLVEAGYSFSWKTVEIDMSMPSDLVDIITHILANVTQLRLRLVRTDKVENPVIVQFLIDLITKSPKLKYLQLEAVFLEQILHDVFSVSAVQDALCKLESLEISTGHKMNDATHYLDSDEGEDGPFPRNFLQLSLLPMKLQTLILGKISTMIGTETGHVKFIPNLLTANSSTLTHLTVHMPEAWKLEVMETIHCPKLKKLDICAYGEDAANVCAFLTNQPLLEELRVYMKEKFSSRLLKVIQGKSGKLKRLELVAKNFTDPGLANRNTLLDWSFLSAIKGLKSFSITRPYSTDDYDEFNVPRSKIDGTGVSFLKALPPSLTELKLRRLDWFWFDITADRLLNEVDEKFSLLNRFLPNLTSLSIFRCDDLGNGLMDDDLFQRILPHCSKLRSLEITHALSLSDHGISGMNIVNGIHYEESGISIQNLTGLNRLIIKSCPSVTIEGIMKVAKLPYLRHLEFLGSNAAKKANMLTLVEQNPSLESLSVHIHHLDMDDIEDIDKLREELKKVNRRIVRVENLDDDRWLYQDSDSDADEAVADWEEGGSDYSGGGYPGYQNMLDNVDHYDDEYDDPEYYDHEDYEDDDDLEFFS